MPSALLPIAVVVSMSTGCGSSSPGPSATASATAVATATPTPTAPVCSNASVLATWSVTQLAEQVIVIPVSETDVASITPEVAAGAGGVILFGSAAPANLGAALRAVEASAPNGIAPLVMTDEEGGVVQRMANLVGSIPSARAMAATMSPSQIQALATSVARRMRGAGITMDLAPVVDLDAGAGPNNSDPDGTRSFSINPSTTAADANAFAAGLQAGGIIPVVKHFPGLGQASANTDVKPATTLPWTTLEGAGIVPFKDAIAAGAPAVMIANASVPGLTTLPASISPAAITDVLRDQLGFQGLVMTDSLSAGALADIGYSVPKAVVAAVFAGADMVLYTAAAAQVASVTTAIATSLVAAVTAGTLDRIRLENAALHVLTVKSVDLCAAS
ncbi:MAG: glycoside hydrolase family 3 N-terminal domain-containing protein [Candidatus Dormiibacterota bacterium]